MGRNAETYSAYPLDPLYLNVRFQVCTGLPIGLLSYFCPQAVLFVSQGFYWGQCYFWWPAMGRILWRERRLCSTEPLRCRDHPSWRYAGYCQTIKREIGRFKHCVNSTINGVKWFLRGDRFWILRKWSAYWFSVKCIGIIFTKPQSQYWLWVGKPCALVLVKSSTHWFSNFSSCCFSCCLYLSWIKVRFQWVTVICFVQNVLEKFEFFPIKCRVQRSLENFKRASSKELEARWNQKVRCIECWKSIYFLSYVINLRLI